MKLVDWQTIQRSHTLHEMRRLVLAPEGTRPAPSTKPVVGPVINWMRRGMWRMLGIRQVLRDRNHRLAEFLTEVEKTRPVTRYQVPDHAFSFREGTQDWSIFYAVYVANEYKLPEAFSPEDVIIDIGTHIGSFAYLALVRGAGRVYCFEPDRPNFEMATLNLGVFGDRVRLQRKAVWRSDRPGDDVFAYDRMGPNTGGGCVLWMEGGEKLDVVAFDDVMDEATEGGRKRVKVLKVDCEGAEYPVLLTSKRLHLVDTICGEYHALNDAIVQRGLLPERARIDGIDRYDCSTIVKHLEKAGFRVTTTQDREMPQFGLFFATRD